LDPAAEYFDYESLFGIDGPTPIICYLKLHTKLNQILGT